MESGGTPPRIAQCEHAPRINVPEKINKIEHIKKLFLSITAKLVNITILILRLIIAEGIIYKENYSVIDIETRNEQVQEEG